MDSVLYLVLHIIESALFQQSAYVQCIRCICPVRPNSRSDWKPQLLKCSPSVEFDESPTEKYFARNQNPPTYLLYEKLPKIDISLKPAIGEALPLSSILCYRLSLKDRLMSIASSKETITHNSGFGAKEMTFQTSKVSYYLIFCALVRQIFSLAM